jgi:hypothetical protein
MKVFLRRMVLLLAVLALAGGLFGGASGHSVEAAASRPTATYVSPERIQFVSYSKQWNQQKLKALYAELMKNMHGEELGYLGKVVLSNEDNEEELGVANMGYSWTEDDMSDIEMDELTEIVLYGADENTTVESMATTLSHEYGHHFTYYWLIRKERKLPSDPTTKWASIRAIKGQPVLFTDDPDHPDYTHYWDPGEIMADDYMALFGSPTAKLSMVNSLRTEDGIGFYGEIENEQLPPVMTLAAVRSYWLKLSGIKDPQPFVLKEPKLKKIEAVQNRAGGIDHKLIYDAGSANSSVAARLQYIVYWENEEEEFFDFTDLTTGKLSIVVPDGLPETELTFKVYAYDPKTKQFVYARPVVYDLSKSKAPVRAGK